MHIVQALGSSGRGGAERFFTRFAKALHARGIPQAILTRRKAWAAGQLASAGIPVESAWFGGKYDFLTRLKYKRLLKANHATVALNWLPQAAVACPQGPWVRVARLGKCYPLSAFSSCDHLIANLPRIAAYIESQGWPASRISTIPNFVPANSATPARRAAFNTPEDSPLILWLGRMEREKGPDIAVRAIAACPNAYLWMAGVGPYEDSVKELAAQMGVTPRIRFLGWRDEVHTLMKAADMFIRCSRGEGLSYVLEAFSNGVPVVSARSMDSEHLIADGQSGMLVPKDDAGALASALNALIDNRELAHRLGEGGRASFTANYSEEIVAQMYLDLFRRLEQEYAWRMDTLHPAGGGAVPDPAHA